MTAKLHGAICWAQHARGSFFFPHFWWLLVVYGGPIGFSVLAGA